MGKKFIRHEHAIQIFYRHLDEIIIQYQTHKYRIIMFGSGTPANMAIYYLKIHDVIVEAILDNNQKKQGTQEYDTPIYSPEDYLSDFDENIRILIASSYEDEMIQQLKNLGYEQKQIVKLIDFKKSISDYSFVDRTGFRMLDRIEIREHQLKILKHLKWLCDKHGLRYWLCGGTLLGAVRHHGYIPWDDDIDVLVEMNDLKKLTTILQEDPEYGIATFIDLELDFCDSCSYMYEMSSDADVNYFPTQVSCGISIDLFPLVGIPENEQEQKQYIAELRRRNEAVWNKMYSKKELRKAATELMDCMSRYHFDESLYCGGGRIISQNITKESWLVDGFRNTEEMCFEGESFRVPKEWQTYLHTMYGKDYMIPPPKERQVAQHQYKAYVPEK